MEIVEGQIYCEYHGCIHEETTDPYDYGYSDMGVEPECSGGDWRVLWAGRYVDPSMERH